MTLQEDKKEKTRIYMRAYYLAHSTRPRMIHGSLKNEKLCKKCNTVKQRIEYGEIGVGINKGAMRAYCKACECAASSKNSSSLEWYERVGRKAKLKKYGITLEDYDKMLAEQNGACALCNAKNPGSRHYRRMGKTERFHVDHCHTTGKVRGLLCMRCNTAIGMIFDSATVAERMGAYLRKGE